MWSVIIVGAGPTGLAAANLLGQAGIATLLLERNPEPSDCPRAISIDDEGLRICQALGLADAMSAQMLLNIAADYVARRHFLARVAPVGQRNGYPLISTLHQPIFEATLLQGLARFDCVQLRFGHSVEAVEQDGQEVRLSLRAADGTLYEERCRYALACDGGKSTLRQALAIPLRPTTWRDLLPLFSTPHRYAGQIRRQRKKALTQRWLVVDCQRDTDPTRAALFFCNPARPAVTVPAPHAGRRWEFMLLPGECAEDLLATDILQKLIQQARSTQPPGMAHPTEPAVIVRKSVYTFHAALATTFARGRIFLLGDAAHLMPPFGGQGMNSGLRDAHNLTWKLQLVLDGLASPRLLESYEQERLPGVAQMILFSALLGAIIMPTIPLIAWLRDIFFRSINVFPAIRSLLSEMRVKPQTRYTRGCILSTSNKRSKKLTGTMLPQPYVLTATGTRVRLDDMLGNGFALIRLYEKPGELMLPPPGQIWAMLGVKCVNVVGTQVAMQVPLDRGWVVDCEGELAMWAGMRRDVYVLVRPDRYVMGVFEEGKMPQIEKELCRLLK